MNKDHAVTLPATSKPSCYCQRGIPSYIPIETNISGTREEMGTNCDIPRRQGSHLNQKIILHLL